MGSRCQATNGEFRASSGLSGPFDARPLISAQFSRLAPSKRVGTGADRIGAVRLHQGDLEKLEFAALTAEGALLVQGSTSRAEAPAA